MSRGKVDMRVNPESVGTRYSIPGTQHLVLRLIRHRLAAAFPLCLTAALLLTPTAFADPTTPGAKPAAAAADGSDWTAMLFVFMLASFIGLGVVTRVSRLLHTPLMSITNAISAIAVVGAITVAGAATTDEHPLYLTVLGAIALAASMTNIVSGFLLTDRMLKMFKKQEAPKS